MKLFSSSKKSGSTEDKDSSAQMHQAEVDSVEAQRAAQSVPLTDDPQLPPARLMHRLGFPASNDLRYYCLNTEKPDEDEMRKAQRRIKELESEVAILKQAAVYFAKNSK